MTTVWKTFPLNPRYQVSTDGQVRRTSDGRLRKIEECRGYTRVMLCYGSGNPKKRWSVHRLVAITFLEPVDGKDYINHKNGIRSDNTVGNLEWCTASENERHKYDVLERPGPLKGRKGYAHHCSMEVMATSPCGTMFLVFGSGAEAARNLGLPSGAVPRVCSGEYSHYRGWSFEYTQMRSHKH